MMTCTMACSSIWSKRSCSSGREDEAHCCRGEGERGERGGGRGEEGEGREGRRRDIKYYRKGGGRYDVKYYWRWGGKEKLQKEQKLAFILKCSYHCDFL